MRVASTFLSSPPLPPPPLYVRRLIYRTWAGAHGLLTWAIQHPYFKYYSLIFTCDIRLCILSVWHRNPTFLFHCHSQFNTHISKSNIQLLQFNIAHWQFNIYIYFKYYSHATFVSVFYLNLCSIECLVCVLCCRVRYTCSAMQHSCLDIELSLSAQLRAFCGLWLVYDDLTDVITLY